MCCSFGVPDTQRLAEMVSQCQRDLDKQTDLLQELHQKVHLPVISLPTCLCWTSPVWQLSYICLLYNKYISLLVFSGLGTLVLHMSISPLQYGHSCQG